MQNHLYDLTLCKPMTNLVKVLESFGYRIVSKEMRDYHFNEIFIRMHGNLPLPHIDSIESIFRHKNENGFYCSCHWSGLEIEDDYK